MIIDRTHVRWGLATVVASAAVTVLYLANKDSHLLPFHLPLPAWIGPVPPLRGNFGATPLGLVYGTGALLIFLFAALLGWRRSHSTWRLGRIQIWLKAHIWLTIFTIPLVLLHCSFHSGGPMTEFLMALYAFVMVSGFYGLALQNIVPTLMKEYLPEESIYDQIPYIRAQMLVRAQGAVEKLTEWTATVESGTPREHGGAALLAAPQAESMGSVFKFFEQEALPYLGAARPRGMRLRRQTFSDDIFRLMNSQVPEMARPIIDEVRVLCDEKRRIDFQERLHHWLHSWLIIHAPASLLLVVLTIWHAIVASFLYA